MSGTVVEFGRRDEANAAREQHADHLTGRFDRRHKSLEIADDAPEDVVYGIERDAAESRADQETGTGTIELTREEKARLGPFTPPNHYMKAAAVKGILTDAGVSDWSAYYDPELTAREHRSRAEQWAQESRGSERLDAEESEDARNARAHRTAEAEKCGHAEDHCEQGDDAACEFLVDECGLTDEEAQALIRPGEVANTPDDGELTGEAYGALSRLWSGYKAGISDAKRAAAGINAVRARFGQPPLAFEELGGRTIQTDTIHE